jgi:branched-chain amino acid transport system substrate-binding protein
MLLLLYHVIIPPLIMVRLTSIALITLLFCAILPSAIFADDKVVIPQTVADDFAMAEDLYRMQDWDNAARYYKKVWEAVPDTETAAASLVRLGMCRYFQKSYEAAITDFRLVIDKYKDSHYVREAHFFAAKAAFNYGDWAAAAFYLTESLGYGPDSRYYKRAYSGLKNVMRERMLPEEVRRMLGQVRPFNDTGDALFRLAKELFYAGDKERAVVILYWLDKNFPATEYNAEVKKLLEGARQVLTRIATRIGVLLPLSGDMKGYGDEALSGAQLAVDEYNKTHSATPISLVVRDSGYGEKVPEGVINELIDTDRVIALVGPLFNNQIRNLVGEMDYAQVPLITPGATDSNLTKLSPLVFITSLTTEEQGRDMADYAVKEMGWKRLAILAPQSAVGQELAAAFADEAAKTGGKILANVSYPEIVKGQKASIDYSGEVRKIKAVRPQAIYIPGYTDELILITSQLSFSDVASVLLGANGWNENRLIRVAGKYVEGAYFTTGYFGDSASAAVRNFQNKYLNKYGSKPGYLAAQSYDATMIVLENLGKGAKDGKQLAGMLSETKGFQGVSGRLTMKNSEGKPEKESYILTIRQGTIIEAEKKL